MTDHHPVLTDADFPPLPEPALWHDAETSNWSKLRKPARPTYDAYYTAEQFHSYARSVEAAVLRAVQQERKELLEALRAYVHAIHFAPDRKSLIAAIKDADDKARAVIAKYAPSSATTGEEA